MGKKGKKKQTDRVIEYIRQFGSITQLEAMRDLGVMRLSARIADINSEGEVFIKSKMETSENRYGEKVAYARYFLEGSV